MPPKVSFRANKSPYDNNKKVLSSKSKRVLHDQFSKNLRMYRKSYNQTIANNDYFYDDDDWYESEGLFDGRLKLNNTNISATTATISATTNATFNTFPEAIPDFSKVTTTTVPNIIKLSSANPEMNSNVPLISTAIGGVILTICVGLSIYLFVRYKRLNQSLSDVEMKEFLDGMSCENESSDTSISLIKADNMNFDTKYNLLLSELYIDTETILGRGTFGIVFKGLVKNKPAAIKQPNKDGLKCCLKSILCEVKILSYTGAHQNIVGFLGAYIKEVNKGILYIATEFCSNGSLESFLRKKKSVVSSQHSQFNQYVMECTIFFEDLYRFCFEIASGMEHIERKQVVHGDLSARNVLLDENYTCKIGDFGLSRKLYHYKKYVKKSQEPLPWKWMAFESLTKMEFTSKSDVWSYGVTIWEIFSLGTIPYSTFNMTIDFPNEIRNGLRLSKPEFASQTIYLKMIDCWNLDAKQRPSFAEIADFFNKMQNNELAVLEDDVEVNYSAQM